VREATVCAQTLARAQVKPADDPVPRRAGAGVLGGGRHVLSNHYGAAPASKRLLLLLLLLLLFPLLLLAQRAQGQPQIVARLFERLFHLAVAVLAKHGPQHVEGAHFLLGGSLLPARAQQSTAGAIEKWGFDPSALVAEGQELLQRAPDPAIDQLFQAVRSSLADPHDAE